jgi:hypothetical protein
MEEPMVAAILIKENMEVLGSDGTHIGFVDHLADHDAVRLTADDSDAEGEPHEIPLSWVKHVEMKIPPARRRRAGRVWVGQGTKGSVT